MIKNGLENMVHVHHLLKEREKIGESNIDDTVDNIEPQVISNGVGNDHNVSCPITHNHVIASNIKYNDFLQYNSRITCRDKFFITSVVAVILSKFIDIAEWSSATLDAIIHCSVDHSRYNELDNDGNLIKENINECLKISNSLTCYFAMTNESSDFLLRESDSKVQLMTTLEDHLRINSELIITTDRGSIVLTIREDKFYILDMPIRNTSSSELSGAQKAVNLWYFEDFYEAYYHLSQSLFDINQDDDGNSRKTYKIVNVSTALLKSDISNAVHNELIDQYCIANSYMETDQLKDHPDISNRDYHDEDDYFYEIIRGNIHQGDICNFEPSSRGKQCTANAMTAIVLAELIPMNLWTPELIDYLLKIGNKLYLESANDLGWDENSYEYLVADEVRREVKIIENVKCTLNIGTQYHGNLTKTDVFMKLSDCLHQFSLREVSAILTVNLLSIGVISKNGKYYIIDSHSRDERGKAINDGKACLLSFNNISVLHDFIISIMAVEENNSNYCNVYHMTVVTDINFSANDCKTLDLSIPLILRKTLSDRGLLSVQNSDNNEVDNVEDDRESVKQDQKKKKYKRRQNIADGKLIVDYRYVFYKSRDEFEAHKNASFDDECRSINSFDFAFAKPNGLQSTLVYECTACTFQFEVASEPQSENLEQTNNQIILGCYMTGIGFSQLEYLFGSINMRSLTYSSYVNAETYMGLICTKAAYESVLQAGKESKELALKSGRIIKNSKNNSSIPYTAVVTDGCWGKRSYSSGLYNSASGAAVSIDFHTHKVIDFGVANKRCFQCQSGNQKSHVCWRNYHYARSSSSMESSIILDIFRTSLEKHSLIYKDIICDGDSSVFRSLETARVYREHNIDVHRTLCSNHILRRLSTNLTNLSKSPQFSYNNSMTTFNSLVATYRLNNDIFPFSKAINMRSLITDNTGKIVNTIRAIGMYWREQNHLSSQELVEKFKIDIENVPYHVFGCHNRNNRLCPTHYCESTEGYNYYEYLTTAGVWNHIIACFSAVIASANDVLLNYNNNIAESFNSVVGRVLGGDRIDFSKLSKSYTFRVCCAVIHFNSPDGLCQVYRSMEKDISAELQRIEEDAQRKKNLYNLRDAMKENHRRHHPEYKNCYKNDCSYGPGADIVLKSVEDIESLKKQHIKKLKENQKNRHQIQMSTKNQSDNPLWHEIRRTILTASNFKAACSARLDTTKTNLVKKIMYSGAIQSAATSHGKAHEKKAIERLSRSLNTTIDSCGIFIDDELEYLGASPDGLIGDDGIVEIKCPYSLRDQKISDVFNEYKCNWVTSHFKKDKTIKPMSDYYHQIQGQLHITRRSYCWLRIWTFKELYRIKILYDHQFWIEKMEQKLTDFYFNYLLPEILDPRLFSKGYHHANEDNCNEEDDDDDDDDDNKERYKMCETTATIEEYLQCKSQIVRWSVAPIIRLRVIDDDEKLVEDTQ